MFWENIYDIIQATGQKVDGLIVPKNSGLEYSWRVLKAAGIDLEKAESVGENRRKVGNLDILLRRGEDIPLLVEDFGNIGRIMLGITGDDLYDEYHKASANTQLRIENTWDWFDPQARYLRPALCYMEKRISMVRGNRTPIIGLNAKFVRTSEEYLAKSPLANQKKFEKRVYSGDVDANLEYALTDCCIDTVYTGRTADIYGLKVVDIIRFTDLVVISALKGTK